MGHDQTELIIETCAVSDTQAHAYWRMRATLGLHPIAWQTGWQGGDAFGEAM